MKPRLSIIVPYRDRENHLRQFVPHMQAYFARDKVDKDIPYRILIVEQAPGQPFNRGALRNAGFQLSREIADYVCFHDVDYLPLWADYSPVTQPTVGLYWGAEYRPIAEGRSDKAIRHNVDALVGGMLLIPTEQFIAVNGYANDYWGWGHEDMDLHERFARAGISYDRRKGTFRALAHDHEGYNLDGSASSIAHVNEKLLEQRKADTGVAADGLSNVAYEVIGRRSLAMNPAERAGPCEMVTVRFHMEPREDQLNALAQPLAQS